MKFANFGAPQVGHNRVLRKSRVTADDLLSVVVLFDHPFDTKSASNALFSVAAQDHEHLDVVLVLPDLGSKFRGVMIDTLCAQPWPAGTRLRLTEVKALSSRTISGYLMNAGLCHAVGRYIAFLHHQDLILPAFIPTTYRTAANYTNCLWWRTESDPLLRSTPLGRCLKNYCDRGTLCHLDLRARERRLALLWPTVSNFFQNI